METVSGEIGRAFRGWFKNDKKIWDKKMGLGKIGETFGGWFKQQGSDVGWAIFLSQIFCRKDLISPGSDTSLPSLGRGVGLHHAEDIAFGVLGVGQPANAGDGHFRKGDLSALGG
jgi:hypothetical protein